MDPDFDVRGTFAACAVVFLGLTASMALGWRELRGRAGLARFAAGYALVVASAALFAGRGRIPHFLTAVVANLLMVAAAALILEGTRLLCEAPRSSAAGPLAVALAVVGLPWLTYVQPSGAGRTILANGLVAVALAVAAWTSARYRSRGERLLDVVTSAALACCAAAFGARAALEAAGVGGVDLRHGDVPAAIATLAGTLAAVVWTMTVLTSANRRLTLEISREKDSQQLLNRILSISAGSHDPAAIAAAAAAAIGQARGWSRVRVVLPGEDDASGQQGAVGRAHATGLTQRTAHGVAVPLQRNGRTLGVLSLEGAEPAPGAEDVRLAESLAEAISLGLENARLARSREELTHLMVHDLRSPMVSITGALDLLGEAKGLAPKDQGLVQMARRNAAKQNSLIDSILDVWQLEEGAFPYRRTRVAIGTLVTDALRLAEPRAQARRLALVADVPGGLPEAWVDRGLVERVLANLVGNAIKFTPEGGGPVTVSARGAEADGVRLSVSDCGPGIEAALRPRLFSRFAPGAHTARGSGLGLAFCRLAVEASGGRIWLEERPDPGALLVFTLPAAPTLAPEPSNRGSIMGASTSDLDGRDTHERVFPG